MISIGRGKLYRVCLEETNKMAGFIDSFMSSFVSSFWEEVDFGLSGWQASHCHPHRAQRRGVSGLGAGKFMQSLCDRSHEFVIFSVRATRYCSNRALVQSEKNRLISEP